MENQFYENIKKTYVHTESKLFRFLPVASVNYQNVPNMFCMSNEQRHKLKNSRDCIYTF